MNEDMKFTSLEEIKAAHKRIQPFIHRTPIMKSEAINQIAGCEIFFKCENFQKVGAFKARGAANAVAKLTEEQKKNGVATHSSGNHAAALARAATVAGIKSYIVMPSNAPEIKKKAVKGYGGEIIECEPNLIARETTLQEVVSRTGATFIPPYDYMDVIEGQATCALEMWEEGIEFDAIMAPVGGGGLLGGTALTTKYISPKTKVIGCEPAGADDAFRSFYSRKLIPMEGPKTIADGLLTSLGKTNFQIIMQYVDDILTVSDEEIIEAMRLIYERMKIVIEPSCSVPLAALLKHKKRFKAQKVGIILSGGNVDLGKLPF
ncbi:pyridoxal-phosphate dependent enzyme [Cyclobacteriaceae bacterium YHN15]|nr:pyridoxal-phosphate dependent enzyme [Cyclobacteriaceae bacterium YHN15]